MKKLKSVAILNIVAVIILELLPYGAVCVFASDGGESIRKTFSYFSLTPFGFANFGPFLTAILSLILAVLLVMNYLRASKALGKWTLILSAAAVIASLMPLMYGIKFYSIVGALITALLINFVSVNFIVKIKS